MTCEYFFDSAKATATEVYVEAVDRYMRLRERRMNQKDSVTTLLKLNRGRGGLHANLLPNVRVT